MGAKTDTYRANETRAILAPLANLAERHHVAILTLRHLRKGGSDKAIYRGQGSIDFTAAARSVLLAGKDPEDPTRAAVAHIKSNLASTGSSQGYQIREGRFFWLGESNPYGVTDFIG